MIKHNRIDNFYKKNGDYYQYPYGLETTSDTFTFSTEQEPEEPTENIPPIANPDGA